MKEKAIKNPWNFDCPSYDDRSSRGVNAGSEHDVGKRQPVGTEKVSMKGQVPMKDKAQLNYATKNSRNMIDAKD
jgi:hypothetical protein